MILKRNMKTAILDTSFILSCVRNKIDFFEEIKFMGMKIEIPKQVIVELKGLGKSQDDAQTALKLLNKNKFNKMDLKTKDVDAGLIKFAEKNKDIVVATLDREIKKKIKNPKLVIRGKKKLEII